MRRDFATLIVDEWQSFVPGRAKLAREAGYRNILLHAHAGDTGPFPDRPNEGHPSPEYLRMLRGLGYDIGGWGTFEEDDDPEKCAMAANGACRAFGYAYYCANIEVHYPDEAFVKAIKRLMPERALWLSSVMTDPRDWDAWFGLPGKTPAATAWLPQCYLNENELWRPEEAVFWATRPEPHGYGIPANFVKPTVGMYTGRLGRVSPARYAAALDEAATLGFSVYLAETATDDELTKLAGAAKALGLAAF